MSTSSVASTSQPECTPLGGRCAAEPLWPTFLKQPFATVHGPRPNCLRYTFRYVSSLGVSYASTTATRARESRPMGSL